MNARHRVGVAVEYYAVAAKRGRPKRTFRTHNPTELIRAMKEWASGVLPNANTDWLQAIAQPILIAEEEKERHMLALSIARRLQSELRAARSFLSDECDIAIGEEPQGISAVSHLWRFVHETHTATYSLDHVEKHHEVMDPRNREWLNGLQIFVMEVAKPIVRNGKASFEYGYVKSMDELEAAAVLAGLFEPIARRSIGADGEGATLNRGRSQLRIDLRRAMGLRKPKKPSE